MQVFGPKPWGAAIDHPEMMTPTPVGNACIWCEELIADNDSGLVTPYIYDATHVSICIWHRECYMRDILGSIGHQRGTCSCRGGDEDDPPEMSKREAARAAWAFALKQNV